jgi:hypothetical protein
MPKTYNTIPTTTTGSVYTAAAHNNIVTNVNNYRVPPACQVRRTTNLTSYTSDAAITWESAAFDTESPSDPMWAASPNPTRVTIKTAGLYMVTFTGKADATATLTLANANISLNGNLTAAQFCSVLAGVTSRFAIGHILNLAANDFITCAVGLVGGSSYSISGNATAQDSLQTRCTVTWLGQVS